MCPLVLRIGKEIAQDLIPVFRRHIPVEADVVINAGHHRIRQDVCKGTLLHPVVLIGKQDNVTLAEIRLDELCLKQIAKAGIEPQICHLHPSCRFQCLLINAVGTVGAAGDDNLFSGQTLIIPDFVLDRALVGIGEDAPGVQHDGTEGHSDQKHRNGQCAYHISRKLFQFHLPGRKCGRKGNPLKQEPVPGGCCPPSQNAK